MQFVFYYGSNGTGALIASSQGDSTYAIFTRDQKYGIQAPFFA
ncbi:MAG: phytase [Symploca sp. SIO3C6]|uniref:Phytase n=1 Tax=Symploca sp. SIO1C4 TaxID=2607765 RepID=A0A6B3NFJ4_9CYAN|nr:phytase [Symploca sp. SIO3C6]NER30413.1 phytase [Symploca sp. SIO1C4]